MEIGGRILYCRVVDRTSCQQRYVVVRHGRRDMVDQMLNARGGNTVKLLMYWMYWGLEILERILGQRGSAVHWW